MDIWKSMQRAKCRISGRSPRAGLLSNSRMVQTLEDILKLCSGSGAVSCGILKKGCQCQSNFHVCLSLGVLASQQ